jgi:starch phosphorylase
VHNSLPIYSGGLGILAGDHLKSASDMNVPLVAVGLMYRFGYFRQKISHDGWQEERYLDSFENELALKPVTDANGERVFVMIHMRGREVFAQAWLAQIGESRFIYLIRTSNKTMRLTGLSPDISMAAIRKRASFRKRFWESAACGF